MQWPYTFTNTRKDFFANIPTAGSSSCAAFAKAIITLPYMLFQLVRMMIDEGGNMTATYLSMIYSPGDIKISAANLTVGIQKGAWLACDGGVYLKTAYPDLYAAIGDIYATQTNPNILDASGNIVPIQPLQAGYFRVPDFRGLAPVGVGTLAVGGSVVLGNSGGESAHRLVVNELAPHEHDLFLTHGLTNTSTVTAYAPIGNGASVGTVGLTQFQYPQDIESYSLNYKPATPDGVQKAGGIQVAQSEFDAQQFGSDQNYYAAEKHNNMQPYIGVNFYIFAGVPVTVNTPSPDQTLTPI
jgi:microcystin-dependent protein